MAQTYEADIELGERRAFAPATHFISGNSSIPLLCPTLCWVQSHFKKAWSSSRRSLGKGSQTERRVQIEDYPRGYPRFSALIASHDSFHICRRFSNLRARLLLRKQDKLSVLEKQLEKADQDEEMVLFHGSIRKDTNQERDSILSEIDAVLADYDALIKRNCEVLSYEPASRRDIMNLRNWVDGNGCIARDETTYLIRADDLLSVAHPDDSAMASLGALVEDCWAYLRVHLNKNPELSISRDPRVHIFPRSFTARAARLLFTPFVVVLLLTPVIICNYVVKLTARLAVVIISTTCFVAALSGLTRVRAVELVVAGATYTTVLVVFVSNTSISRN
ncbi:hypothetical protein F5Y08DRAFT_354660 [Xylaria arbuscula]|nr:hypothetical protein F5Y08DRAFT_354660 [Xylaria arbuscula]